MTERDWWREGVIYQIYPRSFADSDGDGIGDLRGVIGRLDHLNDGTPDSLGVTAVWLSPFYPSPQADFGYDVSDYQAVDPVYGSMADFDELVREAHARGIRVIVDLVMNHTSARHPWFVESRSSRTNAKRDWYIWADGQPDGRPPNNWLSAFEKCGAGWTEDPLTGQFYLHSFTPEQPDLNWRNPAVREAMRAVWCFWLDRGTDGFRVDVAHRLLKDALLRDNPEEIAYARRHLSHPTLRQRNLDLPEVHEVLADLRATLDSYGERFALGEVPISDDARLAEYFGGNGMHTVFHIAFWEQPWRASAFRATVNALAGHMRPGALPTYALATHDIARTVTRYGTEQRARTAALMILTLRGVPCVYYGEEIGMADASPPAERALDVDGRDGGRVPMQWDATGTGFSTASPWLPFGERQTEVNVAAQDGDPDSLLGFYRRAIWYRHGSVALRRGDYRCLDTPDPVFAYLRAGELLVALNLSAEPVSVFLPELPATGRVELATWREREGTTIDPRALRLGPDEGVLVRLGGFPCAG
jgi:alpha-glucosidase